VPSIRFCTCETTLATRPLVNAPETKMPSLALLIRMGIPDLSSEMLADEEKDFPILFFTGLQ
jgi:hypothetical protein